MVVPTPAMSRRVWGNKNAISEPEWFGPSADMSTQENDKMAYQSNMNRSANATRSSSAGSKESTAIFTTGLFQGDGKGKSLASVKTKEAVTIPAGSYINLYEVDKKTEKGPVFRIQVRPGLNK